ncbi:protein of unknown function [Taphrina deformans PYCC 5710]|uniref:Uncharacterized protein n=1 Tax=Taphrina deformans (strain PYCC 5710 / ATCC 11124 / CBS 356.35 / IMI 108563 / JCM 9778 / NBRC 8474) TaxID=1097556 RepID=R4X7M7_TAPDE|nr:protein of unknown function [Taphrina deformans PYCC 5710]|eukprot:CCG81153.1 protein of unknown function [Taphrina deformans PYCC 5710]
MLGNVYLILQLAASALGSVLPLEVEAATLPSASPENYFSGHACPKTSQLLKAECLDIKSFMSNCANHNYYVPDDDVTASCPRGTFCFNNLHANDVACRRSTPHYYNAHTRQPAVTSVRTTRRAYRAQHSCARTIGDRQHKDFLQGPATMNGGNIMELLHGTTPVLSTTSNGHFDGAYLTGVFYDVPAGTLVSCRMTGSTSGWLWMAIVET